MHQPENQGFKVSRDKLVLQNLRDQIGYKVYPIHRLDSATKGLLLFAKSPRAASKLTSYILNSSEKFYLSVNRGWLPDQDKLEIPLESDSSLGLLKCETRYITLDRIQIEKPAGKKFPTARLSLALVQIKSGRYHQIRRHFNRISHPVIGDGEHGDSHYNRFFRENFGFQGLNLWFFKFRYECPFRKKVVTLLDKPNERWDFLLSGKLFNLALDVSSKQMDQYLQKLRQYSNSN